MYVPTKVTFGGGSDIDEKLTEVLAPIANQLHKGDMIWLCDESLLESNALREYKKDNYIPPIYVYDITWSFDEKNKLKYRAIDLMDKS